MQVPLNRPLPPGEGRGEGLPATSDGSISSHPLSVGGGLGGGEGSKRSAAGCGWCRYASGLFRKLERSDRLLPRHGREVVENASIESPASR